MSSNEDHECIVCNEECEELTPCRHRVHQGCIAQSGKAQCPVCRQVVTIHPEHQETFQRAERRNQRAEEEQNREAAEQIQQEERRGRREPVLPEMDIGDRVIRETVRTYGLEY